MEIFKPFTFLQKMRSAVGKFFFFLLLPLKVIRSNNVAMGHNVLRLCVCLPLAQGFKLPEMLMGQIAQNRCYTLARLIKQ